ncbi:MAG: HlyC/CorC family transporter [Aquabacterium sp.]|jgi:CBS domain containing-hemolysin-like protein|uniref:hemolysin family protein n=1 Tax=Aquabacterium sp. TaxID=1872578 RepID=UPI001B41D0C6|nr:hemolysin family protein [Aquabacterium sp.]MBP7133023.1 HlyC/CorC family transporter [Aquabacterium sp.]MDQ5925474.1 magnesium and cobalt exporter, family [Pseudomonadota bacterium]
MDPLSSLFLIVILIAASAFFALAELSVAASRRLRLRQMLEQGELRAARVLAVQDEPGDFFTAIQIGVNTVAILGGVVGEGAFAPLVQPVLAALPLSATQVATGSAVASFVIVTSLFILLADLFPKRLGMSSPEQVAILVVSPMHLFQRLVQPVVWLFKGLSEGLFRLLGLPDRRDEGVTSADILAMAAAGAEAGVLAAQEHRVIENVLELDTRLVTSAMTARDSIVSLMVDDSDALIRARIDQYPHSTYLVCNGDIDHVVGYVDSKDLLSLAFKGQPIDLQRNEGLVKKVLTVPDRLTLSEVLMQFRQAYVDFAVIINEYSLVVGIVTINDVMSTVMGGLVSQQDEEQIVQRDENSWLIDGITPVEDVLRALDLDSLPSQDEYETLAGFIMVMLRRVPRRTDKVVCKGYQFEVLDVDSYRIDQVMVSRIAPDSPPGTT